MKKIKAELSPEGMRKAIAELKEYCKFRDKMMIAARQMAVYAATVVQQHFGNAVKVTAHPLDDRRLGYEIRAEGKAVGFFEFGAGFGTDAGHPFAANAPYEVSQGSYSRINSRQFEDNGYWYFAGRRYTFVVPRYGLYNGSEFIRQNFADVVRRSLSDNR